MTLPRHSTGSTDQDRDRATRDEYLDVLPRTYRGVLPGLLRVAGALVLIALGATATRYLPPAAPAAASSVATEGRVAPAVPVAPVAPVVSAVPGASTDGGGQEEPAPVPSVPAAATAPHILILSPAGAATVRADGPVHLHADVSDGSGWDVPAEVSWEFGDAVTDRVVLRLTGPDRVVPAGTLRPGRYVVTAIAHTVVGGATDTTSLTVT